MGPPTARGSSAAPDTATDTATPDDAETRECYDVAVIGGGMAGLSAARHAARLGRLVTLFEGTGMYGGQVATIGEEAEQ